MTQTERLFKFVFKNSEDFGKILYGGSLFAGFLDVHFMFTTFPQH